MTPCTTLCAEQIGLGRDSWCSISITLKTKGSPYTEAMPGGARFYHPKSPITIAALVALLFILICVALWQLGWLR